MQSLQTRGGLERTTIVTVGQTDLWEYIRKHELQDPKEKRNIRADEKLLAVFDGKKVVSMFEMTKLVNGHLV